MVIAGQCVVCNVCSGCYKNRQQIQEVWTARRYSSRLKEKRICFHAQQRTQAQVQTVPAAIACNTHEAISFSLPETLQLFARVDKSLLTAFAA